MATAPKIWYWASESEVAARRVEAISMPAALMAGSIGVVDERTIKPGHDLRGCPADPINHLIGRLEICDLMDQTSECLGCLGIADCAGQESVILGPIRPGNEAAASSQPFFGFIEFDGDWLGSGNRSQPIVALLIRNRHPDQR